MVFRDGLYRWSGKSGAHREAVLAETGTHVILTGNYVEEDQSQGIEIIVWPVGSVKELQSVATAEFLSSQRPVRVPILDRSSLGEAVKGEGFEMYHVDPEPTKSIKLNDMRFVSPPPVEDRNCSCGEPATVVVAVMTLGGSFVSTEPFCNKCFAARQTRRPG
jgi:hypothetical protein